MSGTLGSFIGPTNQDPSQQQGLNQYISQGQSQINPGQAQIAQNSPISAAGLINLARTLQQVGQQPQLPAQAQQNALAQQGAMGNPGPTQQSLALAQGLQAPPMQQQINPLTGQATPQAFMGQQ